MGLSRGEEGQDEREQTKGGVVTCFQVLMLRMKTLLHRLPLSLTRSLPLSRSVAHCAVCQSACLSTRISNLDLQAPPT